jgi:hypothetical protein
MFVCFHLQHVFFPNAVFIGTAVSKPNQRILR